jgi:hypothetical protein
VRKAIGSILALVAFGVVGVAVFGPIFVSAACVGRECDGDYLDYGGPLPDGTCQGVKVDENTWASTPLGGAALPDGGTSPSWLYYPGARAWGFHPDCLFGPRESDWQIAYISADAVPTASQNNWSEAPGNLAEWSLDRPGWFILKNSTCANYYVRGVIHFVPGTGTDGGDASSTDGAFDGSTSLDGGDAAVR